MWQFTFVDIVGRRARNLVLAAVGGLLIGPLATSITHAALAARSGAGHPVSLYPWLAPAAVTLIGLATSVVAVCRVSGIVLSIHFTSDGAAWIHRLFGSRRIEARDVLALSQRGGAGDTFMLVLHCVNGNRRLEASRDSLAQVVRDLHSLNPDLNLGPWAWEANGPAPTHPAPLTHVSTSALGSWPPFAPLIAASLGLVWLAQLASVADAVIRHHTSGHALSIEWGALPLLPVLFGLDLLTRYLSPIRAARTHANGDVDLLRLGGTTSIFAGDITHLEGSRKMLEPVMCIRRNRKRHYVSGDRALLVGLAASLYALNPAIDLGEWRDLVQTQVRADEGGHQREAV
ncbi:MAG TPA: hypothetical protein QGH10_00485 [Armatimonadota bacterium]|nr:hypothetical protein [Armatimonadota bacterium]